MKKGHLRARNSEIGYLGYLGYIAGVRGGRVRGVHPGTYGKSIFFYFYREIVCTLYDPSPTSPYASTLCTLIRIISIKIADFRAAKYPTKYPTKYPISPGYVPQPKNLNGGNGLEARRNGLDPRYVPHYVPYLLQVLAIKGVMAVFLDSVHIFIKGKIALSALLAGVYVL